MVEYDFVQSKTDSILLTKGHGYFFVAILVYVDDIILIGHNATAISATKDFMHSKFKLKDVLSNSSLA